MHLSKQQQTFGATLAICAVLGGAEWSAGQEPGSYGWYLSASGGTNSNPVMKQAGHNRDNIWLSERPLQRHAGGLSVVLRPALRSRYCL